MALVDYNLEVMGNEAIEANAPLLAPFNAFSLRVSEDGNNFTEDDTVKVALVGVADDATEYNSSSNNYETDNSGDDTVAKVTLDLHPKHTFIYTQEQMKRVTEKMYQAKIKTGMQKVLKKMFGDAFALVTVDNFGAAIAVTADADWTYDGVVDLETDFIEATGLTDGINVVSSYALLGALKKDGAVSSDADFGGGVRVAQTGKLKQVGGIWMYPTTEVPDNDEELTAIVTNGAGLAMASTIVAPNDAFTGDWSIVTDPMTGIQFLISVDYVKATRSYTTTIETWWGVSVGKADYLKRIQGAEITPP